MVYYTTHDVYSSIRRFNCRVILTCRRGTNADVVPPARATRRVKKGEPMNNQIQFRMDAQMLERLCPSNKPQSANVLARRTIEQYHRLLDWSLNEITNRFTYNEICLIADIPDEIMFHGWEIQPSRSLLMTALFAIEMEDLDTKWKVEIVSFREKLGALTNAQAAAVIEAIDRWQSNPESEKSRECFERYGLIAAEEKQKAKRGDLKVGRDAKTGQFIPVNRAEPRKATAVKRKSKVSR